MDRRIDGSHVAGCDDHRGIIVPVSGFNELHASHLAERFEDFPSSDLLGVGNQIEGRLQTALNVWNRSIDVAEDISDGGDAWIRVLVCTFDMLVADPTLGNHSMARFVDTARKIDLVQLWIDG